MINDVYEYEFKDMKFSKDGQLDELIALDRYAIPEYEDINIGDTVVAMVDDMGSKKVCEVKSIEGDTFNLTDRFGESHKIEKELLHKPLETEPYQLWDRWSKGGASEEKTDAKRHWFENELRWLFDGFRYSLGGRIQLMLGQEYVTNKRAELTAFNCYVIRSAVKHDDPAEQFKDVLDVAHKEALIMKRGGGVGTNISFIGDIKGSGLSKNDFVFYLDENHRDYEELKDRISLGKFDNVKVITTSEEYAEEIKNKKEIKATDSINDGMFDEMKMMVDYAYEGDSILIDFNNLRHRNSIVKSVNGRSSGAVSWMELFVLVSSILQLEDIDNVEFSEIYSHIVHLIIQGGSRRGALMLICEDDNPNVEKFIERKKKPGYLSGANISVGVSDYFMENLKSSKKKNEKEMTEEELRVSNLWDKLIDSALNSAEPGIVWLERYNKESNSWYYNPIVATNP